MAFQLNALDPSNSGSGGASLIGTYRTADAFADTLATGYFNEGAGNLRWTNVLIVKASDKTGILVISSDGSDVVTEDFAASVGGAVSWNDLEDMPVVIAAGATQAAARTAIGAGTGNGTSNLTLEQSQAGIATKPAIAALTSESTAEDIVAALQA